MNDVFKEFNINARLYDIDSNLIYKHDPEDFNSRRVITFNELVKSSHIFTLNHNLKSLKSKGLPENNYSENVISTAKPMAERKQWNTQWLMTSMIYSS